MQLNHKSCEHPSEHQKFNKSRSQVCFQDCLASVWQNRTISLFWAPFLCEIMFSKNQARAKSVVWAAKDETWILEPFLGEHMPLVHTHSIPTKQFTNVNPQILEETGQLAPQIHFSFWMVLYTLAYNHWSSQPTVSLFLVWRSLSLSRFEIAPKCLAVTFCGACQVSGRWRQRLTCL